MSVTAAIRVYNVPKSTLLKHIKIFKNSMNDNYSYISNIDHRKVFSVHEEKKLTDYLEMSSRLQYGLTKTNTRKLAYQFAVRNGKDL